jgi:hypothetical protein
MALSGNTHALGSLRGLVTDEDLDDAEKEWPGLNDFLRRLPVQQRPLTFLELVWRFEGRCSGPANRDRIASAACG